MKKLRKIIFWCHLTAGVTAGIVIIIMASTGVMLALERQLVGFAERKMRTVQRPADTQRLGAGTLLSKLSQQRPDLKPSGLTIPSDLSASATVSLGREGVLFVNPYTGEILGEGSVRVRSFFRIVEDWHRWLGAGGDNRAVGRAVTGACNLAFLVLAISGVYLWWPRQWSWRKIRPVILFQRNLSARARNFNWHNTIGFWSSLLLITITATGAVISYQWATNLLYRMTGSPLPSPPPAAANRPASSGTAVLIGSIDSLDRLWSRAEQQAGGWQSITLRLPLREKAPVVFSIREGKAWLESASSELALQPGSGEIVRWEPYASVNAGRKARTWARFLHTGEAFGLAGQIVAGLASLGGSFLVWTGLALALRRFRFWVRRRRPNPDQQPMEPILFEARTKPPQESTT